MGEEEERRRSAKRIREPPTEALSLPLRRISSGEALLSSASLSLFLSLSLTSDLFPPLFPCCYRSSLSFPSLRQIEIKFRSKLPFLASAMAAARPRPELAPVMTAVGFCCSFGTSVLAAERAPEVTAGAVATAFATTEAREEEAETEAAMDFLNCLSFERTAEAATMTLVVLGAAQAEIDCEIAPRREDTAAEDPRAEEKDCIVAEKGEKESCRKKRDVDRAN